MPEVDVGGPAEETCRKGHIGNLLEERGSRYGDFIDHATVTQALKSVIYNRLKTRRRCMAPDQWEAIDMICHKLGRIANGDTDYVDSWDDIAGYATLVADRLRRS